MKHGNAFISQAAKDAQASHDALIDIFEQIEMLIRRLEIYTEVPLTVEMTDLMVQILVEVLSILRIATKEIKQGRMSEYCCTNMKMLTEGCLVKYMKKLIGRTEIEDGLKRLDKLTQEEAWMAAAQIDKRSSVEDQVQQAAIDEDQMKRSSTPNLISADYGSLFIFSGNQLRENIHKWLSPPDPLTNHNIACGTHHKKTATWFFQGSIFQEWKSTGSLLWIHGKRLSSSDFELDFL